MPVCPSIYFLLKKLPHTAFLVLANKKKLIVSEIRDICGSKPNSAQTFLESYMNPRYCMQTQNTAYMWPLIHILKTGYCTSFGP